MIEPNLFALLGPGTGSARKPDMTLKADVASIFERFMQTGPQGSEESAMGAFPAEMGFAAPLPDPAVLQAKEVGELSISQGKHSDVTSKLAVDLPFGSAFSEQAGMRGPSVDVPRLSFTSSVAVGKSGRLTTCLPPILLCLPLRCQFQQRANRETHWQVIWQSSL